MSTEYTPTGSSNTATVPALSDTADITQAFKDYHDDISTLLDAKAPKASPEFSGSVTFANGATVTLPDNTVTSASIVAGSILNSDINASAAIAYSKLDLAGSITSADIANGSIVNEDIASNAAIADSKLATISTSGKVSNSATTATSSNTSSAIVARDSSGNFSAGTVTANLSGTATNATNGANYGSGFVKITVLAGSSGPANPNTGDIWIQV